MAKKSLFISHAEKDKDLAAAVISLLKNGASLEAENVMAYSLEEEGIPAGEDFISHIKSKIGNPDALVILITKNYLSSRFCLCEMGAVWSLSKNMIPLLVPPLETRHLKKLMPESRVNKMDNPDDLNKFAALVQEHLGLDELNLPRWAMEKKKFINLTKTLIN